MADYGFGNASYHSTALGLSTDPSTAALLAEVDSTVVDGFTRSGGAPVQVTWIVGGSTIVSWALEQALSTSLNMSTAGRSQIVALTAAGQSAQYITRHVAERGDRFRVHALSTFTGLVAAKIIIEPLG